MVNFAECERTWVPLNETLSPALFQLYSYNGPVLGIAPDRSTQVTLEGCRALCGEGVDWYHWSQWSFTLTTYFFPILGVLLQAPFESNRFWRSITTLTRWLGNPLASLTYILWNIKVTGQSALIVDMAIPFDVRLDTSGPQGDNVKSIRDSFFLMNVMNQYVMNDRVQHSEAAEGLLRIVLFSKDLRILKRDREPEIAGSDVVVCGSCGQNCSRMNRLEDEGYLDSERQNLAQQLRDWRRRGVVPVFISLGWFIFSLALSIKSAFGLVGHSAPAHDLALGLLLSWIPVLILGSIVDRNPIAAGKIMDQLNELIYRVRQSLQDSEIKELYINTINENQELGNLRGTMKNWVKQVRRDCPIEKKFFKDFAGQGRIRNVEKQYIAERGRDRLRNEQEARTHLVLGTPEGRTRHNLTWFDLRVGVQILSALIIVCGTVAGGLYLSRSQPVSIPPFSCMGLWILADIAQTVGISCRSGGYLIALAIVTTIFVFEMGFWWRIHKQKPKASGHAKTLDYLDYLGTFVEMVSTLYLLHIVLAQSFGYYQSRNCLTSSWWANQGYMDLTKWAFTRSSLTRGAWIAANVVSLPIMGTAMLYIVLQWLLQSHLNTSNLREAANGLQRTRRFRACLAPIAEPLDRILGGRTNRTTRLVWERNSRTPTLRVEDGPLETPVTEALPELPINNDAAGSSVVEAPLAIDQTQSRTDDNVEEVQQIASREGGE